MPERRGLSFFLPMLALAGLMLLGALCFVPFLRCPDFRHSEEIRRYSVRFPPCPDCRDGRISLKGLWDRHRNAVPITYGK